MLVGGLSDMEKLGYLLHSKTNVFSRRLERAKSTIKDALATGARFYLSFSGGCDSAVLLDLLWTLGCRIDVLWGDDGWDFPETLRYLEETEARYEFRLLRIRCLSPWRDWCAEMGRSDLMATPDQAWGNPAMWDETWDSLKEAAFHGYGGAFLGLLACESAARRRILDGGRRPLYQVEREHRGWHCSPLAGWKKEDVWGYIIGMELPYNPVYDRLAQLGLPLYQRRVAPLTCFRVTQYGSHTWLRMGWPELFNRLAETFPAVVRYS